MTITLVRVGETKDEHTKALAAFYEARLSPFCKVTTKLIKVCPLPDDPNGAEIAAALQKEGKEILSFFETKKAAQKIALCVEGNSLTSEEFASFLESRLQISSEFVFCIGSSHGLSEPVKQACDLKLSLSKMTLPHELARVFLAEQIYRAFSILRGTKYHK